MRVKYLRGNLQRDYRNVFPQGRVPADIAPLLAHCATNEKVVYVKVRESAEYRHSSPNYRVTRVLSKVLR